MGPADNPYQPPTTDVPLPPAGVRADAGMPNRFARLAAQLIDGLVIGAILLPVQWQMGVFRDFTAYSQDRVAQVIWGVVGMGVVVAVNGYLWATRAQSIGKLAMSIKIVTLDGQNADFARIVFRRMLPTSLVALIPVVGSILALVDALAIFRHDRRCVHDHIAGTRVVRA